MTKFLPLVLVAASLAGCSAIQKAQSLTSGGITPFLARSVTLADTTGAGAASTAILVWGTAPTALQRTGGGATKSDFSLAGATITDGTVQPGQTYQYQATFGSGVKSRTVKPVDVASLQAPTLTAPLPVGTQALSPTSEKQPTLTWTATGEPAGFLVSVNVLPGLTGTTNADAAGTPVYTAFISGPKHVSSPGSYSVAFGAKSDLSSFSDDVMTALKAADGKGRFEAKDENIPALEAGKAYAVLVLPIAADEGAINVGFGKPALGNWVVN